MGLVFENIMHELKKIINKEETKFKNKSQQR